MHFPVGRIWSGEPSLVELVAGAISDGRAPAGFGRLLARACEDAQIDVRVALALASHETGKFAYGGPDPVYSADPSFHNYGGIKTGDSTATARFLTVPLGVLALVAHLAWYVYPAHVAYFCGAPYDPRHFANGHKERLRVVNNFGHGVWNGGDTYATAIARHLGPIVEALP